MKILFLTQTDIDGPASRYRAYQFRDYLKERGAECTFRPAITKNNYLKVYSGNNPLRKSAAFFGVIGRRLIDAMGVSRYDIVFLQREVIPQIYPFIEKMIIRRSKNVIFDFDDAIFLVPAGRSSLIYKFRYRHNIREIIKSCRYVVAGNAYLRDYAAGFNPHTGVIPTCVDTDRFDVKKNIINENQQTVIGWIGTEHSLMYLKSIENVFVQLSRDFNICLHVIGGREFTIKGVRVINKKWDINTEVADLQALDIGVAPLFDDGWGKGKCGLKALQYMACGVPLVCSHAGVYKEIITEGQNGFLAANERQWTDRLSRLVQDRQLRERIALAARKTVEEQYSLKVNAPKLKAVFDLVLKGK